MGEGRWRVEGRRREEGGNVHQKSVALPMVTCLFFTHNVKQLFMSAVCARLRAATVCSQDRATALSHRCMLALVRHHINEGVLASSLPTSLPRWRQSRLVALFECDLLPMRPSKEDPDTKFQHGGPRAIAANCFPCALQKKIRILNYNTAGQEPSQLQSAFHSPFKRRSGY